MYVLLNANYRTKKKWYRRSKHENENEYESMSFENLQLWYVCVLAELWIVLYYLMNIG